MRPRPMAGRMARRGAGGHRGGPPRGGGAKPSRAARRAPARGGRRQLPTALVAIHRLSELATIEGSPFGGLALGALVTHADLERSDLVRRRWPARADAPPLRPGRPGGAPPPPPPTPAPRGSPRSPVPPSSSHSPPTVDARKRGSR